MSGKHITRRTFMSEGATVTGALGLAAQSAYGAPARAPLEVRFGLNLLVYTAAFSKDQVDLIKKVADMGFDGVEIPFNDLNILDPKATAKAREQAGVGLSGCAVLMPGTSITTPDAAERKVGVERLKRIVDITAEMGGNVVGGPLYAPVGKLTGKARTQDEWNWGVEGLRSVAEHAGKAKIVLAVEPLNRFETHYLNTIADAAAFAKAVDHPNLKVQADTFHANIEEKDTPAAIRAAGNMIGHFHASENDRGIPGTGQVPWKECFAALRAIDYKGWITIESFAMGILDLCAAACIWRPIYDTADGLATDGLAFLKAMARLA